MIPVAESNIEIQKSNTSKLGSSKPEEFRFGRDFTDHMYISEYRDGKWGSQRIVPYGDISYSPAISSLHYGQSIFEGMKAYKGKDGKVRLFRPFDNARRMNRSAERMCMPSIPEEQFVQALKELVNLDAAWVPETEGCSLYIRPFMFADEVFLGVKPAEEYTFMVICSPASSYYPEPVKVKVERNYSRAAQGGVGRAKAAGNYAAAMYPMKLAAADGYHQLIWTDSVEHKYLEEAGTMNLMFVKGDTLITPSLDSGTILEGITRDSVIKVAKHLGYKVEERKISVDEIVEAFDAGELSDAFGLGTAANIAPIRSVGVDGRELVFPEVSERQVSNKISQFLSDLKYGSIEDPFDWVYTV